MGKLLILINTVNLNYETMIHAKLQNFIFKILNVCTYFNFIMILSIHIHLVLN